MLRTILSSLLFMGLVVASAAQETKPVEEKAKPKAEALPKDATLPEYEKEIPEPGPRRGVQSEFLFVNATDENVTVGLRVGEYGKNVSLAARGAAQVRLPNNAVYTIFYLIPKEPKKESAFREAIDSIHSPDGVALLLRVDRASRGSRELPGGELQPVDPTVKKVPTLFQGRSVTVKADNFVISLSTTRGDGIREIKQEEKKPEEKK